MSIRKPRADYDPRIPVHAVCPGCITRPGGVVTRDCPICEGAGLITLGRKALVYDTPAVVGLAAQYALTAAADIAMTVTDHIDAHRQALPAVLARMVDLGIIEETEPWPTTPRPRSG